MNEILTGVIIGGVIGIIGQIIILVFNYRNKRYIWKKEKNIEHLENKKRDWIEQYKDKLPSYDMEIFFSDIDRQIKKEIDK